MIVRTDEGDIWLLHAIAAAAGTSDHVLASGFALFGKELLKQPSGRTSNLSRDPSNLSGRGPQSLGDRHGADI